MSVSLAKSGVAFYTSNVEHVFSQCSPRHVEAGALWYPAAREIARECGDVVRGAAVLTLLSPRNGWDRNVALARECFAGTLTGGYLSRGIDAANAVMNGADPAQYVKGPKVRAFMATIIDPAHDTAVVDVHAYNIANGSRTLKGAPGVVEYREIAQAYANVAAMHGVYVSTVQAATWLLWREWVAAGIVPIAAVPTAEGIRYTYAAQPQGAF